MAEINILQASGVPESSVVSRAAECLTAGGLIVAPTETRYGLLARADVPAAAERLCRLKGRSHKAPLSVFLHSVSAIEAVAELTKGGVILARRFLPGPVTLVLPSRANLPSPVVIDGSIGIRVSSSPVIRSLTGHVDAPLTATSANPSGAPEAETIEEIVSSFGVSVDLYLDGGVLDGPVSTVVDCRDESIRILREGAVAAGDIHAALKEGSNG